MKSLPDTQEKKIVIIVCSENKFHVGVAEN